MIAVRIAADVAEDLLASARRALCRLLPASTGFWLVRPGEADVIAAFTLVLFDGLPGFLVALASEVGRHV